MATMLSRMVETRKAIMFGGLSLAAYKKTPNKQKKTTTTGKREGEKEVVGLKRRNVLAQLSAQAGDRVGGRLQTPSTSHLGFGAALHL